LERTWQELCLSIKRSKRVPSVFSVIGSWSPLDIRIDVCLGMVEQSFFEKQQQITVM
jgi:hypothetical protein